MYYYNAWLVLTVVELLSCPKKHFINQRQTYRQVTTFNFTGMDENKKNQQVKQLIFSPPIKRPRRNTISEDRTPTEKEKFDSVWLDKQCHASTC